MVNGRYTGIRQLKWWDTESKEYIFTPTIIMYEASPDPSQYILYFFREFVEDTRPGSDLRITL